MVTQAEATEHQYSYVRFTRGERQRSNVEEHSFPARQEAAALPIVEEQKVEEPADLLIKAQEAAASLIKAEEAAPVLMKPVLIKVRSPRLRSSRYRATTGNGSRHCCLGVPEIPRSGAIEAQHLMASYRSRCSAQARSYRIARARVRSQRSCP